MPEYEPQSPRQRTSKNPGNLSIHETTLVEAHVQEEKASRKIVREALAVLAYHDSTFMDQFNALRVLIFVTLEHPNSSKVAWYMSTFLFLCIILNSLSFLVGTIPSTMVRPKTCAQPVCVPGTLDSYCTEIVCRPTENRVTWWLELVTISIFSVDYLLRLFTVQAVPVDLVFPRSLEITIDGKLKDRSRYLRMSNWRKTTKYIFSGLGIIDLISIIPFWFTLLNPHKLEGLRALRFLRFLLIFKLGKKFRESGAVISRTLRASLPALLIFVFLTTVMAITFGSVMYFFEGGMFSVTPEFPGGGFLRPNPRNTALEKSPFVSIFTGIYWYVVNTTTLGNCALFPTTTGGRVASCFIAYCGLLSLALPITIIGQNFSTQYNLVTQDLEPHLFYHTSPDTPAGGRTPRGSMTPRKGGGPGTPARRNGNGGSFKSESTMVGDKQDLNYNSPEQEIEALRAHFQQQIDAMRLHMQSSTSASAPPAQQEMDALRREIQTLRMGLQNVRTASVVPTPPMSEDEESGAFPSSASAAAREEAERRRRQLEAEEREAAAQRALRDAEINSFRSQIQEGIRRFSPQAELETFRGGLY